MSEERELGESSSGGEEGSWERFSEWMHCVCAVTFDLELGQALEGRWPAHARLSEQEKTNVCYLAFPDSNSGCTGDTQFHVRLRSRAPADAPESDDDDDAPRPDPTHLWGFVYCRQAREPTLPRGYLQKSVVLLTRLPAVGLMTRAAEALARAYLDGGPARLEVGLRDVGRWPSPSERPASLPLLGRSLAAAPPTPAPLALPALLAHLPLLWELVLTAQPLVVAAASPADCAAAVQALADLVRPLDLAADYRPYFTVHDSEFREFTRAGRDPPRVILGVTNPFFSKTLRHWPSTLRLSGPSPGVESRYRPFLARERGLARRLGAGRPPEVAAALARRHALELTQSFLIPLERYLASRMPLRKSVSAFRAAPAPLPFDPEEFLAGLGAAGPWLTSGARGDWRGLYRAFLVSPNFSGWFRRRHGRLARRLAGLQLEALAACDVGAWAAARPEVELVDMLLRLRAALASGGGGTPGLRRALQARLDELTKALPEDLKAIIHST